MTMTLTVLGRTVVSAAIVVAVPYAEENIEHYDDDAGRDEDGGERAHFISQPSEEGVILIFESVDE